MELTPIKVKITNSGKGYVYPDFGSLASVKAAGCSWAEYLHANTTGWLYDKLVDMLQDAEDSPFGTWYGVVLAPAEFASEAISAFPELVAELTETELETYYEERVAFDYPDEIVDTGVLNSIAAKRALGLSLTKGQADALDASKSTPGIVTNVDKTWNGYRDRVGVSVKSAATGAKKA